MTLTPTQHRDNEEQDRHAAYSSAIAAWGCIIPIVIFFIIILVNIRR